MTNLALKINNIPVPTAPGLTSDITNLGSFVSMALKVAIYVSGTLLLAWLVWGIFQYIFAGGDKQGLASAQKRITWAIVGFIIVLFALALSQGAQGIFEPQNINITPVKPP